jgi:hypothetical protein
LEKWLVAELRNEVDQRHESRAEDSTTDSTDNCWLGTKSIDRTDRELGLLDSISDDILDFTDPILDATGCTDCTKLTDV